MREAEIAALSHEFFEPTFDHGSATVMLGSPVSTDDLGERTVTYLRPDARTLARVEVHAITEVEGIEGPVVEDLLLVLRGSRMYSRAALEELFGPGHKRMGPQGEDGEESFQVDYQFESRVPGVISLRWWADESDPVNMGEPSGPDEIRADEILLHRLLADDEPAPEPTQLGEWDNVSTQSAAAALTVPPDSGPPSLPPEGVDLDEAMDTGAWVGDLAWRMLRPDFTLDRLRELLDAEPGHGSDPGVGGERVVIKPGDARLEMAMATLEGDRVIEVRVDVKAGEPLIVATAAVSDRLNASPIAQPGEITFAFESTRSRGGVSLILASARVPAGPIARVTVIEVSRGS